MSGFGKAGDAGRKRAKALDIATEMAEFLDSKDTKSLAWLGISTKIELPFRDLFGGYLYRKYQDEYIIAREFSAGKNRRIDLAILNQAGNPLEYVQFKACYSFNLLDEYEQLRGEKKRKTRPFNFRNQILDDYRKTVKTGVPACYVLLSVRPHVETPDGPYKYTEKYPYPKSMRGQYPLEKQYGIAKKYFESPLPQKRENPLQLRNSGSAELGKVYGVAVSLDWFEFEEHKSLRV